MDCKFAAFVIALCVAVAAAERGFLLTAPRSLETNNTNIIQLRLYEVPAACVVTITLVKSGNDTVFAEEKLEIEKQEAGAISTDIKFFVPTIENEYNARIRINGTCDTPDKYKFSGEDEVYLRSIHRSVIFIQTDKPFYKPGQTVKLRAIRLDSQLKPMNDNQEAEIHIEDPQGSRMGQWKYVSLETIKQLEFALAEEPPLGTWKIQVICDGQTESSYFEVKEYTLPKFEVTITPPSYVLADVENITVEICAKYTFGKGVQGDIKINSTLETYSWATNKFPVVEFEGEIDGCMNYTINVSLIDTDTYYSYRRIQCFAMVTEKGTGITRNETKQIERTSSPLKMQFMQDQQREYFKPGLPYDGKLTVTLPDDQPAVNEQVLLCDSISRERLVFGWRASRKVQDCRNFTTDHNGVISYTIRPQNTDSVNMYLEAKSLRFADPKPRSPKRPNLSQPQTSTSLRPYFSPSGSFIQLKSESKPIPCGTVKDIGLLFTAGQDGNYQFFYEVVSKGKVVKSDSIDVTFAKATDDVSGNYDDPDKVIDEVSKVLIPTSAELARYPSDESEDCPSAKEARYVPPIGSATISVEVSPEMSGSIYLIVYYVRDDREVVADSQKYSVEKCLKNKVDIEFGDEEKQPGTKTTLKVTAAPNSVCGIKVQDRAVMLMDSSNQLTLEKVFRALETFDSGYHYSRNHCNDKVHQPGLAKKSTAVSYTIVPPRPWSSSNYEDSMTAFEVSGFIVVSDMILFTRPCKGSGHETVAFAQEDGIRAGSGGAVALASVSSRRPAASQANKLGAAPPATKSVVDVRTYFPEDWLFYMHTVDETGVYVTKETLPHTITEWVGSAICLNKEDGLGLSNTTTIRGFQAFFMDIALPYSAVRGEIFPVTLSIFNYLDLALPIRVTLEKSEGYALKNGSVDSVHCIPGNKKETLKYFVQGTSVGKVNFTIKARTVDSTDVCKDLEVSNAIASDGIRKDMLLEPEGYEHEKVQSSLFSPEGEESEDGIYTNKIVLELPPEDMVPDSARAFLVISGDPMGPAIENLDRLVRMPTGCGEQNMVKFTPNTLVLEYLTATGKLTDNIRIKATNNLKSGYQRQMNYRHPDGSYSAFGTTDKEGSMFLTAMVVGSFAAAHKYIPIDLENLANSMNWIISNQLDNGCFAERGKTLDHGLQGGIESQKNKTAPLTAYVLANMLTSGFKNVTVINSAMKCIREAKTTSAYLLSLYAYTSALAVHRLDDGAQYQEDYKKYSTELYQLANTTGEELHFEITNGSKSIIIETVAYSVLAELEHGEKRENVLKQIRFLTKNRNSYGGFHSTKDTVLAIQAISTFAALFANETVDLKVKTSGSLSKTFEINEDNKELVMKSRILEIPSVIDFVAEGKGTGILQIIFRYNSYTAPHKRSFSVTAAFDEKEKGQGELGICVRYLPVLQPSSMGTVEVKLLTGMVANKDSLEQLMTNKDAKVKRYDIEMNNVIFYFDEFSNESTCFAFLMDREIAIDSCKPGTVKAYDYYAKENSATIHYTNEACSGQVSSDETIEQ